MSLGQQNTRTPRASDARGACRNCGSAAPLRFCPVCGQSTAVHSPSVREFVHEFISHNVAFEGALWRTLFALLLQPGRLTVEYFAGRRAHYVAPLRLYLTFSLIFFAISNLGGGDVNFGNRGFRFAFPAHDAVYVAPVRLNTATGIDAVDRVLKHIHAMSDDEKAAHLRGAVRTYLPYVLIVMVPVLGLLLKLFYSNRRRVYGEHLVIALHAQTAAFIFALVSAIPLGVIYGFVVLALFFAQGTLALREVYGGRTWITALREVALLCVYVFLLLAAVSMLAILSLALY